MSPRLQQFCDIYKPLVYFLLFKLFMTPCFFSFFHSWQFIFLFLGRLINDTQWQSQLKSDSSSPCPHSFALLSNATWKKSRAELILLTAPPRSSIKESWFHLLSLNSCCTFATFVYNVSGCFLPGKRSYSFWLNPNHFYNSHLFTIISKTCLLTWTIQVKKALKSWDFNGRFTNFFNGRFTKF